MEACFIPFGLFSIDFFVELEFEGILFVSTLSLELEMSVGEIDFLVLDVHERHLEIDFIFALCPSDERM